MFQRGNNKQVAGKAPHKLHVRKGDRVLVVRGKEGPTFKSGKKVYKSGKVLQVFPRTRRVLIEGINMVKKHTRANPQAPEGGIVEQEAAIHISNVMLEDPSTKKPTRVGYRLVDGRKKRYAKGSGELLDKA